jgi:hypothetical protein
MLLPLLGYFLCMVAGLTAAVVVMLGLSNISTSERVRHYPRAVVEHNVTAANREPRVSSWWYLKQRTGRLRRIWRPTLLRSPPKKRTQKKQASQAQSARPSAQQLGTIRLRERAGLYRSSPERATASIRQLVTTASRRPRTVDLSSTRRRCSSRISSAMLVRESRTSSGSCPIIARVNLNYCRSPLWRSIPGEFPARTRSNILNDVRLKCYNARTPGTPD